MCFALAVIYRSWLIQVQILEGVDLTVTRYSHVFNDLGIFLIRSFRLQPSKKSLSGAPAESTHGDGRADED
jgi:hypothetical protein